jgi:hypothetical protein
MTDPQGQTFHFIPLFTFLLPETLLVTFLFQPSLLHRFFLPPAMMPQEAKHRHNRRIEVARTKVAERFCRLAIQKELARGDDKRAGEGSTSSMSQERDQHGYEDSRLFSIAMYVYCLLWWRFEMFILY